LLNLFRSLGMEESVPTLGVSMLILALSVDGATDGKDRRTIWIRRFYWRL